jgi:putative tryptophan/tyrosine transport system substrate-binding protein
MRRRAFILALGSAVAAWPTTSEGQEARAMRRIAALMGIANDSEAQARLRAFERALHELGWVENRNVRFEYRWGIGDIARHRDYAAELVRLAPDVILATNTSTADALKKETSTVPIVFVSLSDPVGSGIVSNLTRPTGNLTGFTNYEHSLSGKWLRLLYDVAPRIRHVAIIFNPKTAPIGPLYVDAVNEAARTLGVKVTAAGVENDREIEDVISALAAAPDRGLIVLPDSFMTTHRKLIIDLTGKHHVPAIYYARFFVTDGGLISYGPDYTDQYRRAAAYVDRILRGTKIAELPVQVPTKFDLVVNLKTAKALGLSLPEPFLMTADEVIE